MAALTAFSSSQNALIRSDMSKNWDASELFNFINEMTEDDRTLLLKTSPLSKQVVGVVLMLTFLWGSLMKAFIYFNISSQKISERPINVLIIIEQVLHHSLNCVVIVGSGIKVSYPQSHLKQAFLS